jgi:hypothetical protein
VELVECEKIRREGVERFCRISIVYSGGFVFALYITSSVSPTYIASNGWIRGE